jgi:signal transduction histidine kinase
MHEFLRNNRDELIARCKHKVSKRARRAATEQQLANGVPLFLDQLTRTLEAEEANEDGESMRISGASGGDSQALSEMGVSAAAHGKQLLNLGFSVDQVVHDYGDLCQAITDLAFERDAPFTIDEFRTLNRCLDNAIADAVTEFSFQRDSAIAREHDAAANERLGFLVHELRNALGTATMSVSALEVGNMTLGGATGAVLKRSHASLKVLIDRALDEVRSGIPDETTTFSVAAFVSDAEQMARLGLQTPGVMFSVPSVDPTLAIRGNRELLLAALGNILQNAFKFTHPRSEVTLKAYAFGDHVLLDVIDHCGGLPVGSAEKMFTPFTQRSDDKSGLGLGLSIARNSVVSDSGTLGVRDMPGSGCVFTISLPRQGLV